MTKAKANQAAATSSKKEFASRILSQDFEGVYFRDSTDPNRIFNGKPDRAYSICYRDENGIKRFPTVGWRSQGFTERQAFNMRIEIINKITEEKRIKKIHGETSGVAAAVLPNQDNSSTDGQADTAVHISTELHLTAEPDQPELLFDELAERYLTWMKGEGKYEDREKSRYEAHIKDVIGWIPYTWIDKLIARDLKADFLQRMSAKSAKDCLALCRTIFNHSRESGYIEILNPFGRESGFKMPRLHNKCERYLEPSEVDIFFPELQRRSYNVWAMAFLSLRTGMRSTEIFKVKGSDLVPAAGFIWVTAKGGERQKVFCDKEVMDLLLSFKRCRSEYIFQKMDGNPLQEIPDVFRRCAEDLGLTPQTTILINKKEVRIKRTREQKEDDQRKKVWFHTLRHTYASWLAQSGRVTLHELRELMRHSSIEQTERYAHMIPNNSKKEHAGAISEIWQNYRTEQERKAASEDTFKLQALQMIQAPEFKAALEALGPSASSQGAEAILTLLQNQMAKAV